MTTDLEILRADLAAARLPASKTRIAAIAVLAAATLTAVAYAANHYLGEPAPAHVKATFSRLGAWQRLASVDVAKAKVVAFSRHTVLYGAPTSNGGTCLELLGDGGFEYEVFCDHERGTGILLFEGIPVHGTATRLPPVAVSGRIGSNVATLEARVGQEVERVHLGLDGFFSFEPRLQAAARRGELVLLGRDAGGSVVDLVHVPAPLALDTVGSPARVVHGVDRDPRAKHAFFEIWAYQALKLKGVRCAPRKCPGWGYAQTGVSATADIHRDGSFTYVAPSPPPFKQWFLTLVILDGRFIQLDRGVVDGWPVPDEGYWRKAKLEAR